MKSRFSIKIVKIYLINKAHNRLSYSVIQKILRKAATPAMHTGLARPFKSEIPGHENKNRLAFRLPITPYIPFGSLERNSTR